MFCHLTNEAALDFYSTAAQFAMHSDVRLIISHSRDVRPSVRMSVCPLQAGSVTIASKRHKLLDKS